MKSWFKFEMKGAVLCVDLAAKEGGGVATEAPVLTLDPPTVVETVEVISPVEIETAAVPGVGLDVIVSSVPWHARRVEAMTPGVESRRPEVHHEDLFFVKEGDVRLMLCSASLIAVNEPSDVIGGPFDGVLVPVSARLEASDV